MLKLAIDNALNARMETSAFASRAIGDAELAKDSAATRKLDVQSWLPAAANEYKISPNINDYLVVPVVIMPTDIPNRNSVAFPYEELLKFNVQAGMPAYRTWVGKPTFMEHENGDYTQAKGIVFDSTMRPMKGTKQDLAKVICLCGFDITKDPQLVRAIKSRQRTNYSMGAFIDNYECSICGNDTAQVSGRGRRDSPCGHVVRGRFKMFETAHGTKPAYYLSRGIAGFEVSSVASPAWISAHESETIFDLT